MLTSEEFALVDRKPCADYLGIRVDDAASQLMCGFTTWSVMGARVQLHFHTVYRGFKGFLLRATGKCVNGRLRGAGGGGGGGGVINELLVELFGWMCNLCLGYMSDFGTALFLCGCIDVYFTKLEAWMERISNFFTIR